MPRFTVTAHITVSAVTHIEAATREEARELAGERDAVWGGINSGANSSEQFVVEELDGEIEIQAVRPSRGGRR
jgi:hypothetical protein